MKQPALNEIQILVFGQLCGYGESILIHIGDNSWIIVDSCLNENDEPVAISYLKELNVNVCESVKLVVATHWHNDHIEGLNQTILECSSAKFVMPNVFKQVEFLDFLSVFDLPSVDLEVKLRESEIIRCLEALNNTENLMLKSENSILLRKGSNYFNHKKMVEVISLSPSDIQYNDFLKKIRAYSKAEGSDKILMKKEISDCRNELSMAILVKIGDVSILLGSDVEEGNTRFGWKRIVSNCKDWNLNSRIYKVAHHGSKVENCDEIWTNLLKIPWSIVTPWTKGGNRIPDPDNIEIIKQKSYKAFITSERHLAILRNQSENFEDEPDIITDKRCGVVCLKFNTVFNKITGKVYNGASILE